MQDDCYLIAADGWKAETYRIIEKDKKGKEKDKGWTCDLVPKGLIVARYFANEQETIEKLEAELDGVAARITGLVEENGGEEGVFPEPDKVNKANVTERLKEIKGDKEAGDEAAVLNEWVKLANEETDLKKHLRDAENALDAKAHAQYPKLTEDEIKMLVVDDKWLAALDTAIHGEMDRISQALTQRVKELTERYETLCRGWSTAWPSWRPKLMATSKGWVSHGSEARLQTDRGRVVPEDWGQAASREIATKIGSGLTPTGGSKRYKKYGRPFVRSQNVGWGSLFLDDLAFIDEETHNSFSATELKMDDILLNITGASIGRSALADARLIGGNVNQHVCIVRTDPNKALPKLVNLLLLSDLGQRQIDSFQAGGNRQGLNFLVRSGFLSRPRKANKKP